MASNRLTLAVAGSRKTQGIVDECAAAPREARILVLTYTTINQAELRSRLQTQAGDHAHIEVLGWFSFLLTHIVKPFVPYMFPGRRVQGFDFDSTPRQFDANDTVERYFDKAGRARRVHLPQLAFLVERASGGAALKRLQRLYDRVYIDEVQDLCGYDLEILQLMLNSSLPLNMVGDVRQAVLATNERERKNKPYMYMGIWNWFQKQEKAKRLSIAQSSVSWRCRPEITSFADSLFGEEWGFQPTQSANAVETKHDGVFLVRPEHVDSYMSEFGPLCLRDSANSGKQYDLNFVNYRLSKGLTRTRVLIHPTGNIAKFLQNGTSLTSSSASRLYVAVTRAEQSVAFILDKPKGSLLPYWTPF